MPARSRICLVCCSALFLLVAPVAIAGEIGLSWQPSPGASGYRVSYGSSPRTVAPYDNSIDVGPVTSTTISTGLIDCQDSYFAVTAYNLAGESGYSTEVASWPRPEVNATTLSSAMQGSQSLPVSMQGMNFQPGADLRIVYPPQHPNGGQTVGHVSVDNVSATCDTVQAVVTVDPLSPGQRAAPVGSYDLLLDNLNGWTRSSAFEVLIDPARFDINADDPVTQGWIDGRDVIRFVSRGLSAEGDPLYHPDFDFDGNGFVDGEDLVYLVDIDHFGSCWRNSSWTKILCPVRLE